VRRELSGGVELDDDRARIDVDEVHRFISTESYWGLGRPRELIERTVAGSARVLGLYDGEKQIGFARAVSDGVSLAYLADVYVLGAYRGRGLGYELVREMVEDIDFATLQAKTEAKLHKAPDLKPLKAPAV